MPNSGLDRRASLAGALFVFWAGILSVLPLPAIAAAVCAPDRIDAQVRISRMMWDSVLGEGGLHEVLNITLDGVSAPQTTRVPRLSAQVLLFPDRRKRH